MSIHTPSTSSRRDELASALDQANAAAQSLQSVAGQIYEEATHASKVAGRLVNIVRQLPNDSALTDEQWANVTIAWLGVSAKAQETEGSFGKSPLFSLSTQAADLTTSFTTASFASIAPNPQEVRQLTVLIKRQVSIDELATHLQKLGLDTPHASERSPSQLLAEAKAALSRPSGPDPAPAAVLIPAREAVQSIISQLLRKRAVQDKTPSSKDKLSSIGRQLGLAGLPSTHFDGLAANWDLLNDDLSAAKRSAKPLGTIEDELDRTLAFIEALANSIDPNRFRK